MKIVFCGDLSQNNGPANVNKNLYKYCDFKFIDTKQKNKVLILISFVLSLFNNKVYIFSCNYRVNYFLFKLAKFFKKKTIYYMHGYAGFEAIVNKTEKPEKSIKRENYVHNNSDLILTVSENYMKWFLEEKPEYINKTYYLTNGINIDDYKDIKNTEKSQKNSNSIAVCGANRAIKHNGIIASAVNKLCKKGYKCSLNIYGYVYPDGDAIKDNDNVIERGRIPQQELFKELKKTNLFIVNSIQESFGLSIIDALMCGCNVLISKNSGIISILDLQENDIIYDIDDMNEIQRKIIFNLEHSNNKRILDSIDFEHYSCQNSAKRLEKIAQCILNDKDYKTIK